MFESQTIGPNLYRVAILDPKVPEDAPQFFALLDQLIASPQFGLILYTEGKAGFSDENKRKLTTWFRIHKPLLKEKCLGYARVNTKTGFLGKLESKAMKLSMPCPYIVTKHHDEAVAWLNALAQKQPTLNH